MRRVLVIDCNTTDRDWMEPVRRHLGARATIVEASAEPVPGDPTLFAGLVLSGSAASALEPERWQAPVERLIRAALHQDVPVLGICFGHQLLARAALGARAVARREVAEVGWLEVEVLQRDPILAGFPDRFRPFVTHGDEVRPVRGVQILARSRACPVQAMRLEGHRAWGVQFHLEMTAEQEEAVVDFRVGRHPEQRLDRDDLLSRRVDNQGRARSLFDNFVALLDQPGEAT